jgi:hypothetical protein
MSAIPYPSVPELDLKRPSKGCQVPSRAKRRRTRGTNCCCCALALPVVFQFESLPLLKFVLAWRFEVRPHFVELSVRRQKPFFSAN